MKAATLLSAIILSIGSLALAQTAPATPAVTDPDPMKAINTLRTELVDAFNKGDIDRLLAHLDPDCIITWQNAEVTRGPEAVRAYYNKMMTGPDHIVSKLSAEPVVDDRHIFGDHAISWGNLHDDYTLNDGSNFKFDSRFTATIAKRGDVWKITSFHASVNAFDNPVLKIAAKRVAMLVGVLGALGGMIVGIVVALIIRRKRTPAA